MFLVQSVILSAEHLFAAGLVEVLKEGNNNTILTLHIFMRPNLNKISLAIRYTNSI